MSENKNETNANTANANVAGENTSLINANEDVVKDAVRKMMAMTEMCRCDKCFHDVCAIVLNKIEPRYVTTYKGVLLSQLPQITSENHGELAVIIARAIKLVSDSPQH